MEDIFVKLDQKNSKKYVIVAKEDYESKEDYENKLKSTIVTFLELGYEIIVRNEMKYITRIEYNDSRDKCYGNSLAVWAYEE